MERFASRREIAAAYDAVADDYAAQFISELDRKPFDRALLNGLAAAATGWIADLGSGPGHVGAYLAARGARAVCIDLSARMAALARGVAGDMAALPFRSRALGGAVAMYSLIHLSSEDLPRALLEIRRVLIPGGRLLASVHEGAETVHVEHWFRRDVHLSFAFFNQDILAALAGEAGFVVESCIEREPYASEGQTRRIYLTARA